MNTQLSKSAHKVQQAIENCGFDFTVKELPGSTRSAEDAAGTIGCEVARIVKSLIFRREDDDKGILVLVSGVNQADPGKLEAAGSGRLTKANADFVRQVTGFAIGGVPPIGHDMRLETYIDQDLLQFDTVWAAAGTPNAVFEVDPSALVAISRGIICELTAES